MVAKISAKYKAAMHFKLITNVRAFLNCSVKKTKAEKGYFLTNL